MKKVVFVGGWGESSAAMLKRYAMQTPKNSGIWRDIQGIESIADADYIVVMDRVPLAMDLDNIQWEKVIYFEREPHQVPWMNRKFPSNIFFDGSYANLYNVPTWWINVGFDELVAMPYPQKVKNISCVNSGLYGAIEEHRLRVDFLSKLTQQTQDIDVYGRGIQGFISPDTYKGELNYNGNCKLRGFLNYRYALVLENVRLPNSWTEKICDPLLSWAVPIYWGASNIDYFFPLESYFALPYDLATVSVADIADIVRQPVNVDALRAARDDLLFKWNIWPTIKRIIDGELVM